MVVLCVSGPEDGHVYGQVDVGDTLQSDSCQHAPASSDHVHQAPGEDHGEDELDDAVDAGGYEGGIAADDACVCENLRMRQ